MEQLIKLTRLKSLLLWYEMEPLLHWPLVLQLWSDRQAGKARQADQHLNIQYLSISMSDLMLPYSVKVVGYF